MNIRIEIATRILAAFITGDKLTTNDITIAVAAAYKAADELIRQDSRNKPIDAMELTRLLADVEYRIRSNPTNSDLESVRDQLRRIIAGGAK